MVLNVNGNRASAERESLMKMYVQPKGGVGGCSPPLRAGSLGLSFPACSCVNDAEAADEHA